MRRTATALLTRNALIWILACSAAIPCISVPVFAQASAPRAPERRTKWNPGAEVRSRHYRILSDLKPDDSRLYSNHLDLMYEEYARRLASLAQRAPEVPFVLMFAKEQDYLDTLKYRYGVNATGSGGMFFISPEGAALAFFIEGLPRSRVFHVVQHEGFHQYAHSRFVGSLPPWLNEGLAEYFGEALVIDGRVIIGQASPAPVELVRKAIEQNRTIDFLRLLTMTSEEWNANVRAGDASVQYMQSWSMVQYLSWADNGRYQRAFEAYIGLIHGGMPSDRAFVQAFQTNDLRNFEGAWKSWAVKAVPSSLGTAAAKLTFMAEGLLQLSNDGVRVDGFEDMLSKLRERSFRTEVTIHGRTHVMEANEDLLVIPKDELARQQPVFDLIPAKAAGRGATEKKREETHPTPPVVTTRGLEPRELVLRWTRRKTGEFDYDIMSPKDAPPPPKAPKTDSRRKSKDQADEPAKATP